MPAGRSAAYRKPDGAPTTRRRTNRSEPSTACVVRCTCRILASVRPDCESECPQPPPAPPPHCRHRRSAFLRHDRSVWCPPCQTRVVAVPPLHPSGASAPRRAVSARPHSESIAAPSVRLTRRCGGLVPPPAEAVATPCIAAQRLCGRFMHREITRLAELAVAHGQNTVGQVDIVTVEV